MEYTPVIVRRSVFQGGALILQAALQTSHPAGSRPDHGPAFGTGELQEGTTTLLDGFCTRPDNGGAPLDRWPSRLAAGLNSSGYKLGFNTAPSGTTPCVAKRHRAISSLRAIATTITLRARRPAARARSRNQPT